MSASDARFGSFAVGLAAMLAMLFLTTTHWVSRQDLFNDRKQLVTGVLPQAFETQHVLANRWFMNTASVSTASIWIIGTSIGVRGFDPCQNPSIANFSRPGQGILDVANWVPQALAESEGPTEIILDASLLFGSRERSIEFAPETYARLFAFVYILPQDNALHASFSSMRCAQRLVNYRPNPFVISADENTGDQTQERELLLIDALAGWCRRQIDRRVTFAVFPLNPTLAAPLRDSVQARLIERSQSRLKELSATAPDCGQLWVPDAGQNSSNYWYDSNHFMPEVGSMLLATRLTP